MVASTARSENDLKRLDICSTPTDFAAANSAVGAAIAAKSFCNFRIIGMINETVTYLLPERAAVIFLKGARSAAICSYGSKRSESTSTVPAYHDAPIRFLNIVRECQLLRISQLCKLD